MKKIFITGNVGRDPESRFNPSGESFVVFSLAVNSGTKANPRTDWMEISCNGRQAEFAQKYIRKGSKLLIEGTPSVNAYINKEGQAVGTFRVIANNMEFIGNKQEDTAHEATSEGAEPKSESGDFNAPGPSLNADDIPF